MRPNPFFFGFGLFSLSFGSFPLVLKRMGYHLSESLVVPMFCASVVAFVVAIGFIAYGLPVLYRPLLSRWARTSATCENATIIYDSVLWVREAIPGTTNTWTMQGPFCPDDRLPLLAIDMVGHRRPPSDWDSCASCGRTFDLNAPPAGLLRQVGHSRRDAITLMRSQDPKGPADGWIPPRYA